MSCQESHLYLVTELLGLRREQGVNLQEEQVGIGVDCHQYQDAA
jgi:hypothetical protein